MWLILSSKETQWFFFLIIYSHFFFSGRSTLLWIQNTWSPCWSLSLLLCSQTGTTGWEYQAFKIGLDWMDLLNKHWIWQEAALNEFKCPHFLFSSMKSWPTWLCHGRLSWFTRWQECFYLSLTIFTQDNDHALVSVTLFQKVVDEFKTKVDVLFL